MKKLLAFLTLLAFLLLCWLSWNWYKRTVLCCENLVEQEVIQQGSETVTIEPLMFDWDSGKVVLKDGWENLKAKVLDGMADGKILRIVGPFFEDEINTTAFDDLGLARADAIRQLFDGLIDPSRIEIGSKLIDFYDGAKTSLFGNAYLRWLVRNDNIQEIDDRTLIYFPFNSTEKLDNQNINNYLKDVAEVLQTNDEKVYLTGHTDNSGDAATNHELGLGRANAIRDVLIGYGLDASRIIVDSKGETVPIDTNETEEGRAKNRRVELIIK